MSIMKKLGDLLSSGYEDEEFDEFDEELEEDTYITQAASPDPIIEDKSPVKRFEAMRKKDSGKVLNMNNGSSNSQVVLVKPRGFSEDVGDIASQVLNKCTVIINLEQISPEEGRRLIDVVIGVAYATSGTVKPVSANTVVVTPASVTFSGDFSFETDAFDTDDALFMG